MRKIVAIGNSIFLYLVLGLLYMLILGEKNSVGKWIWENLFGNLFLYPLFGILIVGIILYILNMILIIKAGNGKYSGKKMAKTHLIVKLVQIPAYIGIFLISILCLITIFTAGFSIALWILDVMSIGMTGLFAAATFRCLKWEEKITGREQVLFTIGSFLFCIDTVISVIGYVKSRKKEI